MNYVVIGSTGYIGQHLCDQLRLTGTVYECSSKTNEGINPVTGLFSDHVNWPEKVDVVYFLAQSPYYRLMPEYAGHLFSINCVAAVQAATLAVKHGAHKFIYASTGNVYSPSFDSLCESSSLRRDNYYALSKVMAEDALSLFRSKLDVVFTRIFGAYGPLQTDKLVPIIINKVINHESIFIDSTPNNVEDIDGLRVSLIYIDDLVSSLVKLSEVSFSGPINFSGIKPISVRDIALLSAKYLNVDVDIKLSNKNRDFDLVADTRLYCELFGPPQVSFDEGLQRVMNYMQVNND